MKYLSDNAWRRPIQFVGGPKDGVWLSVRPQTYHLVFPGLPKLRKTWAAFEELPVRADFIYHKYVIENVGDQVVFKYQGVS